MMRLMEVLLHGGSQLSGWRTAQIHDAIRAAFDLSAETYTLTQLRYDLRKNRYLTAGPWPSPNHPQKSRRPITGLTLPFRSS
jgi:hypothetical protein